MEIVVIAANLVCESPPAQFDVAIRGEQSLCCTPSNGDISFSTKELRIKTSGIMHDTKIRFGMRSNDGVYHVDTKSANTNSVTGFVVTDFAMGSRNDHG